MGAALAWMAKLTTPVLCVDPSKEMLEVVEKMGDFSNTLVIVQGG